MGEVVTFTESQSKSSGYSVSCCFQKWWNPQSQEVAHGKALKGGLHLQFWRCSGILASSTDWLKLVLNLQLQNCVFPSCLNTKNLIFNMSAYSHKPPTEGELQMFSNIWKTIYGTRSKLPSRHCAVHYWSTVTVSHTAAWKTNKWL